jgi:hypothetical protein
MMDGSFDEPPIALRQSRLKLILRFGLWLAFAFALVPALATHRQDPLIYGLFVSKTVISAMFYAALFLFTAIAAVTASMLVSPAVLVLDPHGFTYASLWGARRLSWNDVDGFHVGGPSASQQMVFYNLSQRYLSDHAREDSPLGSFGRSWPISAQELAFLLNNAKEKWGEDHTPRQADARTQRVA